MSWNYFREHPARCVLLILVSLCLAGTIAAWVVAGQLLAPEPIVIGNPPDDLPAETISIKSNSGSTLAGWHVPTHGKQGVVVLLHGIRGSRLSMLNRARMLTAAGYSVVMIDLQAHGESPGDHIAAGFLEQHDATAAVNFARQTHPGEPVFLIGISLGGAAALLATRLDVDAMVLESVFPDIEHAVSNRVRHYVGNLAPLPTAMLLAQLKPRWGISVDDLCPIRSISQVDCPVFIISGENDERTTASETEQLFAAAEAPKQLWLVEKATHEDLYEATGEPYRQRILRFFADHQSTEPTSSR